MVGRFGSREICDVTFKAATNDFTLNGHPFKAGQPVFVIDTATASTLEQSTSTVYAQGGKGYNRLIAWEGEKTVTFNVTDALMSPLGLAMLTGAGLADATAAEPKHVHVTIDALTDATGVAKVDLATLIDELGLPGTTQLVNICDKENIKTYATVLDNNGAIMDWIDEVEVKNSVVDPSTPAEFKVDVAYAKKTIKIDTYVWMTSNVTEITIEPDSFGGTFYVEADTLYRNQDGKDMAASLTFPKVKIQSAFTLSMSPTGDPSTFDFVMDAMPGYTYFNPTKKVVVTMTIVGGAEGNEVDVKHDENNHKDVITAQADQNKVNAAIAKIKATYTDTTASAVLTAIQADAGTDVTVAWKGSAPTVAGSATVEITAGTVKKEKQVVVNI